MFSRFSSFLSFLRLLSFSLAVSFSFGLLWAANESDDDLEETEEESYGPLKIKSQTRLCSADYYIKGGIEKDREEDRKRKNIGIGENISFLLIGKPKGNIQDLAWSVKGDGFQQTDTESFKGEQKITLTARKDLTEDARATITAKTSEGKQVKTTISIKIPKKMEKKKHEGLMDLGQGLSANTADFKIPKGNTVFGDLLK